MLKNKTNFKKSHNFFICRRTMKGITLRSPQTRFPEMARSSMCNSLSTCEASWTCFSFFLIWGYRPRESRGGLQGQSLFLPRTCCLLGAGCLENRCFREEVGVRVLILLSNSWFEFPSTSISCSLPHKSMESKGFVQKELATQKYTSCDWGTAWWMSSCLQTECWDFIKWTT